MTELMAIKKVIETYHEITGLHSYFIQNKGEFQDSAKEKNFFCKCLKTSASALKQCDECTLENYSAALESNKIRTYSCHAGLVKWSVPVEINDVKGVIISEGVVSKQQIIEMDSWMDYLNEQYDLPKPLLVETSAHVREMTEAQVEGSIALLQALLDYYKIQVM